MRAYLAGDAAPPLLRVARILKERGWQIGLDAKGDRAEGRYDLIVLGHAGSDGVLRARIADLRQRIEHDLLVLLSSSPRAPSFGADEIVAWDTPATLAGRLSALLRRRLDGFRDSYQIGDLRLDLIRRSVRRADREVPLTQREFQLLLLLARDAGAILPRSAIIERLWDGDLGISDNAVDALASRLRRRIDGPFNGKMLQTVRGVGYCLTEPEGLQLAS
jgi:two-component system copper resistance phosphate regulon response regulator CusR